MVPDNLYGVFDHETKEWNGIVRQELLRPTQSLPLWETEISDKSLSDKEISNCEKGIFRELIDRKADIAVAAMTINFARYSVNLLIA